MEVIMLHEDYSEKFKTFGKNVEKYRLKANITHRELSEKTGIREQYIKRIEKGDCIGLSTSQVYSLAKGLNIPAYELCEGI